MIDLMLFFINTIGFEPRRYRCQMSYMYCDKEPFQMTLRPMTLWPSYAKISILKFVATKGIVFLSQDKSSESICPFPDMTFSASA